MRIYIPKYETMAGHGSFWEVVSNLWLVMAKLWLVVGDDRRIY